MKRLTKEDIKNINKKIENYKNQKIFNKPNYVPTHVKGPVCFMRWNSSGRGGSCWDDENTIREIYYNERPKFEALSLALYEIGTNDKQKEYIENYLIVENSDAGGYSGYYGDFEDYSAEWIELEKIYKYLGI